MLRAAFLRSTTARMFVPIAIVQMVAAGAMLGFVWLAGQNALARQHEALVDELHADLVTDFREGGPEQLRQVIALRIAQEGRGAPVMLLADASGKRVVGNLDAWPRQATRTGHPYRLDLVRSGFRRPEEMTLVADRLDARHRLLAGWAVGEDRRLTTSYESALTLALLLAIPLALLVALLISRSIAQRIHRLAQTARLVETGALHERVPLDGSGDSFDELGHRINGMLDRIETLVGELRLVTDGLAHDLRSPLTRLKAVIERATGEIHEPRAIAALERVSGEADSLLGTLNTALQITRAEAGIGRDGFVATELGELLTGLAELYAPLAEEHGFQLTALAEPGLVMPLNRELAGQAIGNLIDNALKYAQGGDRIVISARRNGTGAQIDVCDNGPGIAAENHAEAVRRFGRLDPARGIAGSGLGLSLAESVARIHGGGLTLSDNAPGLCVHLTIAGG